MGSNPLDCHCLPHPLPCRCGSHQAESNQLDRWKPKCWLQRVNSPWGFSQSSPARSVGAVHRVQGGVGCPPRLPQHLAGGGGGGQDGTSSASQLVSWARRSSHCCLEGEGGRVQRERSCPGEMTCFEVQVLHCSIAAHCMLESCNFLESNNTCPVI